MEAVGISISDKNAPVARKPCEIETKSLQTTNRKPHTGYTMVRLHDFFKVISGSSYFSTWNDSERSNFE